MILIFNVSKRKFKFVDEQNHFCGLEKNRLASVLSFNQKNVLFRMDFCKIFNG